MKRRHSQLSLDGDTTVVVTGAVVLPPPRKRQRLVDNVVAVTPRTSRQFRKRNYVIKNDDSGARSGDTEDLETLLPVAYVPANRKYASQRMYQVEDIVDHIDSLDGSRIAEYRVQWAGYYTETWVDAGDLECDVPHLCEAYKRREQWFDVDSESA